MKIEKKFNQNDIDKIKSKRSLAWVMYSLSFTLFAVLLYFRHKSSSLDRFYANFFDTIMSYFNVWDIVLHTFFIVFGIGLFSLLFKNDANKDLENKIKIVTKVKVTDKRKITDSGTVDNTSGSTYYNLYFEEESDIKEYRIKRKHFEKINVGDIIDLEYGKESQWVLKIEVNSESIENKWENGK